MHAYPSTLEQLPFIFIQINSNNKKKKYKYAFNQIIIIQLFKIRIIKVLSAYIQVILIYNQRRMITQKISAFKDLPLEDHDRKKTDIFCTIIGALFALTLFILAFVLVNTQNYKKTNFPTDSDHIPCSYGANQHYPFVYFPNINDISIRVCLSRCPNAGDPQLSCKVNTKVPSCDLNNIYSASVNFDRLGGFCAPTDSVAQQKLMETANLNKKWDFLELYDSIRLSVLISLAIGILWSQLVQCFPRAMTAFVTILSILSLAAIGAIMLVDHSQGVSQFWKLTIAIVSISIAVMFAFFLCFFRRRNRLTGVFIDWGTKLSKEKVSYYFFTLLFILLSAGLIFLWLFQHLAFLSHSQPTPSDGDVFLKLTTNIPLFVLNLIQFIWGLQFLKDAYNFILSGQATQWYCNQSSGLCQTFSRLLKFHFGSVVGGSFLNAFFNLIDFLLQALRCYPDGTCPACAPCCSTFFNCGAHLFDLVRTDVYSYINLTGVAYCNSARYCEHLIQSSRLFVGSQSLLYFYRISAYTFTIGVTLICAYFIEKSHYGSINLLSLLIIALFAYCVLSFFVDLHADFAQGLQISYLIEESLRHTKDNETSKYDQFDFKKEIGAMEKSYMDGKFC